MIKRILIGLGAIVLLLVIAAVVLWIYIDRVAAAALTRGVEYAGDVKCEVADVSVSLLSGRIGISELAIKNPKGYPEADMFSLARADLDVRVGSLWSPPAHVQRLELTKPLIRVEAGRGGSNVRVFLDNVQRKLGASDEKPDEEPTRMWVDKLVIKDATVRIGTGLTKRELLSVTLETVELKDIRGKDEQGVTSGELAAMIVYDLVRRSAMKGKLDFKLLVPPDLTKGLATVLQSTGFVFNGATSVLEAPLKTILDSIVPSKDERDKQPEEP